jgi:transcriptional regulator with XRE-family HTH domain
MGERLAQIRKQAKLSQKEVAERMGIKSKSGQAYIARLENGIIKNPSIKTIQVLKLFLIILAFAVMPGVHILAIYRQYVLIMSIGILFRKPIFQVITKR